MATLEGAVLDSLNLNDGTSYSLLRFEAPPPAKRGEWAQAGDGDGATLVRDPLCDNRTVTMDVECIGSSMDDALAKIGALTDKLEEAERQPDGIALTCTPAGGTKSFTLYVLTGEAGEVPKSPEFLIGFRPTVTLTLTAKPFGYGTDVSSYALTVLAATPISYWRLGESSGTVAADSQGTNTGTYAGGVTLGTTGAVGDGNTAVTLNGSTGRVDVADAANLRFTTAFTFEAWVFPTNSAVEEVILCKNNGTDYEWRLTAASPPKQQLTGVAISTSTIPLSTWSHVAVTYDGTNVKYYLNGVLDGTVATAAFPSSTGVVRIGARTSGSLWFVGGLDEVAVYNTVLTATQLLARAQVRSSQPLLTFTIPNVPGDVPAEGRIIVSDGSSQSRRYVEWGLEQRYYNSATSLLIDSVDLVISGFAGALNTRAGAYRKSGAATDTVFASLLPSPVALCGTGVLSHVGQFRVKARVYSSTTTVRYRFAYQDGDGPFRANDWVTSTVGADYCELDLGTFTISPARQGTQKWQGRIDAYGVVGDQADIDYLEFIPCGEGYGKARASYSYSPGVVIGHDEFSGTTAGNNLSARTAPVGGSWATSGVATDFVFADAPGTSETITRSTSTEASPRFGALGSAITDTEISASFYTLDITTNTDLGVLARYVDTSNYAALSFRPGTSATQQLRLSIFVAGTETLLASSSTPGLLTATWYSLRLIALASGRLAGYLLDATGSLIVQVAASSTVTATGGTLASGKPGVRDFAFSTSVARYYDNVVLSTPSAEPISLYSGRTLEFRHDSAVRQDSTGTYYGSVPSYKGSRVFVPPAGTANRTSRVAVKSDRNDLETAPDTPLADTSVAAAILTPRYYNLPR